MSRGLVMRFDERAEHDIRAAWARLDEARIPSLASYTHRLHAPHLSLAVADVLDNETAAAVAALLPTPPDVRVEAAGYFPQGVLFLTAVPTQALLGLQREAFDRLGQAGAMVRPWPTTHPEAWLPHVTMAYGVNDSTLGKAAALVAELLPAILTVSGYWIEDGDTGDAWRLPGTS